MVNACKVVIRVCHGFSCAQVIVHALSGSSGPVRVGIKLNDFARNPIDARRGNNIAGKGIADKLVRAARVRPCGVRIVDDIQIAVPVARLREIASLLRRCRNRSEHLVGCSLTYGFIVEKEKSAVADDGPAQIGAVEVPLEQRLRDPVAIVLPPISVQMAVA